MHSPKLSLNLKTKKEEVMKKYIVLAVCLGILLVSSMAMATDYSGTVTPGAGIKGTAHDLSLTGAGTASRTDLYGSADTNNAYGGGDLDRICIWCHTPHFSITTAVGKGLGYNYVPLWNHGVTSLEYVMYSNGTDEPNDLKGHASKAEELLNGVKIPGGVSRLCLSCHDGSVAVNAYGRMTDGTGPGDDKSTGTGWITDPQYIKPDYMIGGDGLTGDLSNHHPIGFDYDTVEVSDNEIQKKSANYFGTYTIGDLLWSGKMECTTCHDVHNTKNTGEKFLWKSDAQSALCLTCHLKAEVEK